MRQDARRKWSRVVFLLLAASALVQAGCLAVAAGAGAAGAAGYAYYKGEVAQSYAAKRDDAWAALKSSLGELQMPIDATDSKGDILVLDSHTADGDKVHITLEPQASRIQGEGMLTRVGIRVGTFGDSPVSNRILDQMGLHLVPMPQAPAPPLAPVPLGAPQPIQETSPQTPPPPLLPSEGNKK